MAIPHIQEEVTTAKVSVLIILVFSFYHILHISTYIGYKHEVPKEINVAAIAYKLFTDKQ